MKRTLLVAAAICAALSSPALAADIVTKAPPLNVLAGYPYQGSGLYGGIGAVAAVLSADVGSPAGPGSNVFSAAAALDLTIGYQFGTASNWYAAEASVQYTNMGGAVVCGGAAIPCSVTSKWGFEQRGLIGFPIQTVLAVMPNLGNFFPALPVLPGGVNASTTNTHPYIFVGIREDEVNASFGFDERKAWTIQPVVGLGLRQQWTQGLVVDTSAGCAFANTGISIGGASGASANLGRNCRMAIRFLY